MRSRTTQRYTATDKFIWIVTFAYLFVSNTINTTGAVLFGFTLLVLIFTNFKLKFYKYHIFTLQFCLYCYTTMFWALNGRYSIEVANTIFQTLVCLFVFYEYWKNIPDINILLKVLMWAGFAVVIYTYFYYGVEEIVTAEEEGERLENTFNNVNTIAMLTAIVLIIHCYLFMFVKKDWSVVIWLPCLFIIGVTQSRKAFVMIVLGIFLLYYFKQRKKARGDMFVPLLKIMLFVVFGIMVLIILGKTESFAGLYTRMEGLFSSLTGGEDIDASAELRNVYNDVGWRKFLEKPICGWGMNNSRILLSREVGHITYMHNNYIELLSCGGILGLISYYSMYVYLLFKELKYIRIDNSAILIFTWILIRMVIDWGVVAYSTKPAYFYLMIFFIHLDNMRIKYPHIK